MPKMDPKQMEEHEKEHKKMEEKANAALTMMKDAMPALSQSSHDLLDSANMMIQNGAKNRDAALMLKGAELLKSALAVSMDVVKYDHEQLHEIVPHEEMHKRHIALFHKIMDTKLSASKDLLAMGSWYIKEGKEKMDADMLMNGEKLLKAGLALNESKAKDKHEKAEKKEAKKAEKMCTDEGKKQCSSDCKDKNHKHDKKQCGPECKDKEHKHDKKQCGPECKDKACSHDKKQCGPECKDKGHKKASEPAKPKK